VILDRNSLPIEAQSLVSYQLDDPSVLGTGDLLLDEYAVTDGTEDWLEQYPVTVSAQIEDTSLGVFLLKEMFTVDVKFVACQVDTYEYDHVLFPLPASEKVIELGQALTQIH
jgi:hypothetical protein